MSGDGSALAGAVKQAGVLVSTLVQSPDQILTTGVRVVPISANPSQETLDRLAANQAKGHTTVTVQRVYDLDQTTEAFGHFAAGTLGKLIVRSADATFTARGTRRRSPPVGAKMSA